MREAMEYLLTSHGVPPCEVSVMIAGDEALRSLNQRFRGLDEATDVLTFPAPPIPDGPLGDIAISVDMAEAGAVARRVSVSEEVAWLGIHGGLHLLGMDDRTEGERRGMIDEMNAVATAMGMKPDADWSSVPHESGATQASKEGR